MSDCGGGTLSYIAPIVPWALVIIGWWIINHQNNARESRKERRAAIDRLNSELDSLEGLAIQFHTAANFDEGRLAALRRRLKRLMAMVEATGMVEVNSGLSLCVVRVRQSMTLRNADKTGFSQQRQDGRLLHEISAAVDELRDEVEAAFNEKYH